jgi:phospholipase C
VASDVDEMRVRLAFRNVGTLGAVFHVYDRNDLKALPRRYTVAAGKSLADDWVLAADRPYDLWVLGPNGFHRHFTGKGWAALDVRAEGRGSGLVLTLSASGAPRQALLAANAYGSRPRKVSLSPGRPAAIVWPTLGGWYDLTLTDSGDSAFSRRLAGRLETGKPSTSDPAMGGEATLSWAPLATT